MSVWVQVLVVNMCQVLKRSICSLRSSSNPAALRECLRHFLVLQGLMIDWTVLSHSQFGFRVCLPILPVFRLLMSYDFIWFGVTLGSSLYSFGWFLLFCTLGCFVSVLFYFTNSYLYALGTARHFSMTLGYSSFCNLLRYTSWKCFSPFYKLFVLLSSMFSVWFMSCMKAFQFLMLKFRQRHTLLEWINNEFGKSKFTECN